MKTKNCVSFHVTRLRLGYFDWTNTLVHIYQKFAHVLTLLYLTSDKLVLLSLLLLVKMIIFEKYFRNFGFGFRVHVTLWYLEFYDVSFLLQTALEREREREKTNDPLPRVLTAYRNRVVVLQHNTRNHEDERCLLC